MLHPPAGGGGISAAAPVSYTHLLEAAEQKVYAIRRGQSAQDMVPLRQVLPDVLDRLSEMSESEDHLPGQMCIRDRSGPPPAARWSCRRPVPGGRW